MQKWRTEPPLDLPKNDLRVVALTLALRRASFDGPTFKFITLSKFVDNFIPVSGGYSSAKELSSTFIATMACKFRNGRYPRSVPSVQTFDFPN